MSVIQRQGIPCGVGGRGGTLLPPQSVNWKYCGMILAQRLQGIAIPQATLHLFTECMPISFSNTPIGLVVVVGGVTVLHSASSY